MLGQLTVASYCVPGKLSTWDCVPCKKVPDMRFIHIFKNRTGDICGYIGVNDV